MGTVFRKMFTKPLPAGTEIVTRKGERRARWKDAKGRTQTAKVTTGKDGAPRLSIVSRTFIAKYRDGAGLVREVPTGCRDEVAARGVLADLERRAELVRAEVLTPGEDAVADHQQIPVTIHFDGFEVSLRSKGVTKTYRENCRRYLRRIAAECQLGRLVDLKWSAIETWLARCDSTGMSARSRNAHRQALVAFCNWCVETGRLLSNPFAKLPQANEKADPRRQRRALTEDQLARLLYVARWRPLAEYGRNTSRRDAPQATGRKTWYMEPLTLESVDAAVARARERLADTPELVEQLEAVGRERALIYKTLVLTGLRKGELASLTVGQAHLQGTMPFLELSAADEKNRQGSQIPLRADLAADLREWLAERDRRLGNDATIAIGCQRSSIVSAGAPLLNVPKGLLRILNRDLQTAGIPKRDERGRTVDVHALRHSFGTLLSKGGVAPRTAQAAMRHSTIDLTMNVYTDPKLLDVQGALDVLPALRLDADLRRDHSEAKSTGTDDRDSFPLAPTLAPTSDCSCMPGSVAGKMYQHDGRRVAVTEVDVTAVSVKEKNPLTTAVSGSVQSGRQDLNLRPLAPQASALIQAAPRPVPGEALTVIATPPRLCKAGFGRRREHKIRSFTAERFSSERLRHFKPGGVRPVSL